MEDVLITQFEPEYEIRETISDVWDSVQEMIKRLLAEAGVKTRTLLMAFLLSCSANPLPAFSAQSGFIEECPVELRMEQNLSVTESVPSLQETKMLESLMQHYGSEMSRDEIAFFKQVLPEFSQLTVEESLLIYNAHKHHVSIDLLLPEEYELHVTVYFEKPNDKLVYSLEKDEDMISCRCVPFCDLYSSVTNDIINNK